MELSTLINEIAQLINQASALAHEGKSQEANKCLDAIGDLLVDNEKDLPEKEEEKDTKEKSE